MVSRSKHTKSEIQENIFRNTTVKPTAFGNGDGLSSLDAVSMDDNGPFGGDLLRCWPTTLRLDGYSYSPAARPPLQSTACSSAARSRGDSKAASCQWHQFCEYDRQPPREIWTRLLCRDGCRQPSSKGENVYVSLFYWHPDLIKPTCINISLIIQIQVFFLHKVVKTESKYPNTIQLVE